jgi:hypothetical protein
MRGIVFCCAILTTLVAGGARAADGWVALFDGRTLDGWVQRNGSATYRVADGAIVGRTSEGSPNSFLATEQAYGDFELEFEVRVDDPLNSGVQIRSRARERAAGAAPDEQAGRVFGPQVEIEASPGLAGYLYGEAMGRGWLTPAARLVPHGHFREPRRGLHRPAGPRCRGRYRPLRGRLAPPAPARAAGPAVNPTSPPRLAQPCGQVVERRSIAWPRHS